MFHHRVGQEETLLNLIFILIVPSDHIYSLQTYNETIYVDLNHHNFTASIKVSTNPQTDLFI